MGLVTGLARRVVTTTAAAAPRVRHIDRSRRRRRFIRKLKLTAGWKGANVDVHVAADADISRSVTWEIWRGTHNTVVIGAGASIADHVRFSLRGGRLDIGAGTQIRRFGTYHVGGDVRVGRESMLGVGTYLHCAESVHVGDDTLVAEYSTIADSEHIRTPPGVPVMHHVRTAPVRIGSNVWIASHSVITSGVVVGDLAVVAAGSVVTSDVATGTVVAGAPARPLPRGDRAT